MDTPTTPGASLLTASAASRRTRRSAGILRGKHLQEVIWLAFVLLVVTAGSVGMLFPVFWMATTSLKESGDILLLPPKWIPLPPQWQNYPDALEFMRASVVFGNTIVVTLASLIGDVCSASVVAYAFARLRAPGKNILFMLVLSTLMIPYQVRLIPEYLLFAGKVVPLINWVDTLLPLIVPTYFGSAFFIFLLRQFYQTVPTEMDDAAKIDGASYPQILWHVMIPMSLPALGAIAIFSFVNNWNDFFRPLIYLTSRDVWTVAIALRSFTAEYGATPWNLLMAASFTALIPLVVVFFVAQRYFIQGIVISGLKG
ncbi:MAG TPA: carbohydrate ABC transporter permease [Chloroflexota bacterium]|nr:carbohydrate ABC transporter permease [Chloroflexota bacterium]